MSLLQAMLVAALLVGGLGVALLGTVKVPLARKLQIDKARVGGLVSVFGFVLIPVILTAGFLSDLVGRQLVLVGGCGLMAASLFLLVRAPRYAWALASVLLFGAAWALLVNVVNVLTPVAFPGSLAFATNLANAVFGLGAFLTPLLVVPLVRRTSLSATVSALALLTLAPAVLSLGIDFAALVPAAPPGTAEAGAAGVGIGTLLANPVVWLCGFALFFYGPLEASLAAWTTTYLGERGVKEAAAARVLSGFWLAFMLSRLATALSLPSGWEAGLTLVLALACIGVLLGMVFSRGQGAPVALVLAAGLIFGPIFPTVLALLLGHAPASLHGRAVGLFFAIGGIGWTVIPILLGAYASRTSVQRGFLIAAGAAVGLTLIAVPLLLVAGPVALPRPSER